MNDFVLAEMLKNQYTAQCAYNDYKKCKSCERIKLARRAKFVHCVENNVSFQYLRVIKRQKLEYLYSKYLT